MSNNEPYYCPSCNKNHTRGKLYKEHIKYRDPVKMEEFTNNETVLFNSLCKKALIPGEKQRYLPNLKKLIQTIKERRK